MSDENVAALVAAARRWIDDDPDPTTRAELQALVDSGAEVELQERLASPLDFGTAGLRGLVGAGPARMNRAVVLRATRALAEWLVDRVIDARTLPVVVGYDARSASRVFAEDVAGVLAAAGLSVRYFTGPVPTPLVAYAARKLAACAAVCVTASHNPPEYNGYKVYGPLAAQITLPAEQEIAARMAGVGPAKRIARVTSALSGAAPGVEPIPPAMAECYLAELDALRVRPAAQALRIVYTPLHGVGGDLAGSALRRAGYTDLHVVAEQAEPDGRFPTVRFPNPEEPGALQLATALAERVGGDLILANDPDADRLAVSLPNATGRFAALTGNQIGVLLADYVLEHAARSPRPLVVSTIVSSPMLEAVAAERGAQLERTLTGFKWIWKAALELEARGGVRFVFGYEEALGYSIGHLVHDKDGISSAVVFADLVAHCRAAGQSLRERLEQLYRRHGLWVSAQRSLSRSGVAGAVAIQRAVDQLAGSPPKMLAGRRVIRTRDFRVGADERPPWLGESLLVELQLEDQSRLLARPSGTEPKLKLYVDHRVRLGQGDSLAEREAQALAEAHALAEAALAYLGFGDAL